MPSQVSADFFDPGDDAGGRITLTKMVFDGRRNAGPHVITEPFVRCRVADDGKLAA